MNCGNGSGREDAACFASKRSTACWRFIQKSGEVFGAAAIRWANVGVRRVRPFTSRLMVFTSTPMYPAKSTCVIPTALRNSSASTSPGGVGGRVGSFFISILSMVVRYLNFLRSIIGPTKDDSPLTWVYRWALRIKGFSKAFTHKRKMNPTCSGHHL